MDKKVLRNLSYGMYIVGSNKDRNVGCVVNTCVQITSDPITIAVSVNHDNYTNKIIKETNKFSISILGENTDPKIIGTFGYSSSLDVSKYDDVETVTLGGLPIIKSALSGIICDVIETFETSTHTVFLGKVIEMENYNKGTPMTYKYYQEVLKGKSPKNAPTYVNEDENKKEKKIVWRCKKCGYEVEIDELPDDYICPICGATKKDFERIEK